MVFFQVTGHSVPKELIQQLEEVSLQFFKFPIQEKEKIVVPSTYYVWGWNRLSAETLVSSLSESVGKTTPADLKEHFGMGTPSLYNEGTTTQNPEDCFCNMSNLWPEKPDNFRQVYELYYDEMDKLSKTLLKLAAISLNLPENYFEKFFDRCFCALRALFYPKLENEPKPGQFRASEHSDWGSLTILHVKDNVRGLEIKDRRTLSWVPVHIQDGAFVVNLGDLMARWSNDKWQSTVHRVVVPEAENNFDRISFPFFQNPNSEAIIECLPGCHSTSNPIKYEATTTKKYLEMKFRSTQNNKY